jgi:hypothetical protein
MKKEKNDLQETLLYLGFMAFIIFSSFDKKAEKIAPKKETMVRLKTVLFLISFQALLFAQNGANLNVQILPVFENKPLILNNLYKIKNKDSVTITMLKFYLSNIVLYQDSTVIWAEKNSFHLVDLSVTPSLALGLDVPKTLPFNRLKCNLGIDSLTNEAGVQWAAI